MVARTLPGIGLMGGYDDGEDGWGPAMNANLVLVSTLLQGHVKARVAVLPAAPVQGDIYILTTDQSVQAYDNAAWVVIPPQEGWLLHDDGADVFVQYDGAAWIELATAGGGDDGDYVLPDPSGMGGKIVAATEDGTGYELIDPPEGGSGGSGGGGRSAGIFAVKNSNVVAGIALPAKVPDLKLNFVLASAATLMIDYSILAKRGGGTIRTALYDNNVLLAPTAMADAGPPKWYSVKGPGSSDESRVAQVNGRWCIDFPAGAHSLELYCENSEQVAATDFYNSTLSAVRVVNSLDAGGGGGAGGSSKAFAHVVFEVDYDTKAITMLGAPINVLSVERLAAGRFRVNFSNPYNKDLSNLNVVMAARKGPYTDYSDTGVTLNRNYNAPGVGGVGKEPGLATGYVVLSTADEGRILVTVIDATALGGGGGGGGSASPVIVQRAHNRGNGSATASLAKAPTAGNMLLMICSGYSSEKTVPAGFMEIARATASNQAIYAWAKVSDGTEGLDYKTQGGDWNNTSVYEIEGGNAYASRQVQHGGGNQNITTSDIHSRLPGTGTLLFIAIESDNNSQYGVLDNIPSNEVQLNYLPAGNHTSVHRVVDKVTIANLKFSISAALNAVQLALAIGR